MSFSSKKSAIAYLTLAVAGFLLAFYSFRYNSLNIVDPVYFRVYQQESESLVLGKMLADRYQLDRRDETNLGFTTFDHNGWVYEIQHLIEPYKIIDSDSFPKLEATPYPLQANGFRNGVSSDGRSISIYAVESIFPYHGHNVVIDGKDARTVLSSVYAYPYMILNLSGDPITRDSISTVSIESIPVDKSIGSFTTYLSQYGLQGKISSFLYNSAGFSFEAIQSLAAAVSAATIVAFCVVAGRMVSPLFGIILYGSILLSPWLLLTARNLYWVPFTWFLPAVFGGLWLYSQKMISQAVCAFMVFASVLVKCLCGYEFITSVILLSASFSAIYCATSNTLKEAFGHARKTILICLVGVAGFVFALCMHASRRGNTVWEGLVNIFEQDVKRRTYGGDSEGFDQLVKESLNASPLEVLNKYLSAWTTDIVVGIGGNSIAILFGLAIVMIAYKLYSKESSWRKDLAILVIFASVPLSWFILAKAHSFVHTHINFVLYYMGCVGAIFYVIAEGIRSAFKNASIARSIKAETI